jgi:hypothetical protein
MKRAPDGFRLGSARASSRACGSDRALAIANFSHCARPWSEEDFGEGTEISTRGACAPQSFPFAARSTRAT